jgi:cysteine desulfurase
LLGGGQERNMRAGTENVYGIVGFAKALELAMTHYERDSAYIKMLRQYMKEQLEAKIPGVYFQLQRQCFVYGFKCLFP